MGIRTSFLIYFITGQIVPVHINQSCQFHLGNSSFLGDNIAVFSSPFCVYLIPIWHNEYLSILTCWNLEIVILSITDSHFYRVLLGNGLLKTICQKRKNIFIFYNYVIKWLFMTRDYFLQIWKSIIAILYSFSFLFLYLFLGFSPKNTNYMFTKYNIRICFTFYHWNFGIYGNLFK